MPRDKRPLSVTVLAWVYIVVGTVGFVHHWTEFQPGDAFHYDFIGIELIRLLAIVCGVLLLRGHNSGRWLALAWIAFHVILSAFHALGEFAIHGLFCAAITWVLLRPQAARYFRGAPIEPT